MVFLCLYHHVPFVMLQVLLHELNLNLKGILHSLQLSALIILLNIICFISTKKKHDDATKADEIKGIQELH